MLTEIVSLSKIRELSWYAFYKLSFVNWILPRRQMLLKNQTDLFYKRIYYTTISIAIAQNVTFFFSSVFSLMVFKIGSQVLTMLLGNFLISTFIIGGHMNYSE